MVMVPPSPVWCDMGVWLLLITTILKKLYKYKIYLNIYNIYFKKHNKLEAKKI